MTRYTDTTGASVLLCDRCRCDMPKGSAAYTLAPGRVADGFISRDYDKGELVLCEACSTLAGKIMSLMGIRRADAPTPEKEAA